MTQDSDSDSDGRTFESHLKLIIDVLKTDSDQSTLTESESTDCHEEAVSQVSEQLQNHGQLDAEIVPANYTVQEYTNWDKLRLYHVAVSGTIENDLKSALREILEDLSRAAVTADLVKSAKADINDLIYLWDGFSFEAREVDTAAKYSSDGLEQMDFHENDLFSGYLSREKIDQIGRENPFVTDETTTFIEEMKGGPKRTEVANQIGDDIERATFLFIRSLQDYGNTAPSEVFISELLEVRSRYNFLFKPSAREWDRLIEMDESQRRRVLMVVLNPISGLLRRSFQDVVDDWVSMIRYIRDWCDGDPRLFFKQNADLLDIDVSEPSALEELQTKLEGFKKERRERIGLTFPYSKKIGRLLFTLMTDNERGYDLMKGVQREHVENFNLPVDAQIIRITLNLGILQIESIESEELKFGEEDDTREGIELQRDDLAEVCRRAWQEVSEQVDKVPAELDHILWSVGGTLGNRRGALCMACPLGEVCDAWESKEIYEAGGSQWRQGGYTFARAHTNRDNMVFFEDWEPFTVEVYQEDQPHLSLDDIDETLNSDD